MIPSDSIARFCVAVALLAAPSPALANDQVAGPVTEETMSNVVRAMIVEAYKKPSWRTAENKTQAAAEFRNDNEVMCFEAFAKQ